MRDALTTLFRASRAVPRAVATAMALAAACGLGGCAGGGAASGSFAMANSGSSVAFESIDGPPPQVFDRMVSVLDSESKLRDLSVVSREGPASYRVRSYLAAQVSHGRTTIAWVWDVYDSNQQRSIGPAGNNLSRVGIADAGERLQLCLAGGVDIEERRFGHSGRRRFGVRFGRLLGLDNDQRHCQQKQ